VDKITDQLAKLTYSAYPGIKQNKLRELILYICKQYAETKYFGSIKLYKVLYNADFRFFALHGRPLTGTTYVAQEHGPVPFNAFPLMNEMRASGILTTNEEQVSRSCTQHRHIALRDPDLTIFSEEEIQFVQSIIEEYRDSTGSELENASHTKNYDLAGLYGKMPYESVFLTDSRPTTRDVNYARNLLGDLASGDLHP
jgi:uncharacterized phage-associated protein